MNSSKPLLYSVLSLLQRACTACFVVVIKLENQCVISKLSIYIASFKNRCLKTKKKQIKDGATNMKCKNKVTMQSSKLVNWILNLMGGQFKEIKISFMPFHVTFRRDWSKA